MKSYKDQFHAMLATPERVNAGEENFLEEFASKYPFCQSLQFMRARHSQLLNREKSGDKIALAAIYAPDRTVLFNFMNMRASLEYAPKNSSEEPSSHAHDKANDKDLDPIESNQAQLPYFSNELESHHEEPGDEGFIPSPFEEDDFIVSSAQGIQKIEESASGFEGRLVQNTKAASEEVPGNSQNSQLSRNTDKENDSNESANRINFVKPISEELNFRELAQTELGLNPIIDEDIDDWALKQLDALNSTSKSPTTEQAEASSDSASASESPLTGDEENNSDTEKPESLAPDTEQPSTNAKAWNGLINPDGFEENLSENEKHFVHNSHLELTKNTFQPEQENVVKNETPGHEVHWDSTKTTVQPEREDLMEETSGRERRLDSTKITVQPEREELIEKGTSEYEVSKENTKAKDNALAVVTVPIIDEIPVRKTFLYWLKKTQKGYFLNSDNSVQALDDMKLNHGHSLSHSSIRLDTEKEIKKIHEVDSLEKMLHENFYSTSTIELQKPQHIEFDLSKKEDLIIERFLRENPQHIKPNQVSTNLVEVENQVEKASLEDEHYTETIASILYQQKHYEKALRAYNYLILNNPEKKAFFASLIDKISQEAGFNYTNS